MRMWSQLKDLSKTFVLIKKYVKGFVYCYLLIHTYC